MKYTKEIRDFISKRNKITWSVFILLVFFAFSIILTFPLIQSFSNSVPATSGEDTRYFIWNIWQFHYTLFDLGENPFSWSRLLYYPVGFSQAAGAYDNLYNTVLSIPLSLTTNNYVVIYNLLIILNIVVSALGMYLLVYRHFAPDRRISFIIAFAYAFSPYAIHRFLGHINLATIQWIPFFLLYFISLLKNPNKKDALLSGIFLFLVAISSWHYLISITFVIVFLMAYKMISERGHDFKWKKFIFYTLVCFLIAIALITPVLLPFLRSYFNDEVIIPIKVEHLAFSADPLSYITPSPLYFYGKWIVSPEAYNKFSGNIIESTTYLGIGEIALLILIVSLYRVLKKKKEWYKYKKWMWFMGVFYILSLGPHLKIYNYILETIPLPMFFLYKLPFISLARDSARISIYVLIGVLIMLSIFLFYLSKTIPSKKFRYLLIIIFTIFFIERVMTPLPVRKLDYSPFYDVLRQEKKRYAVIEVPIAGGIEQEYNFTQTIHQKFVSSGVVQHTSYNDQTSLFVRNDPLLSQLVCWFPNQNYTPPVFKPPAKKELKEKYLQNNFRYILIHKDILDYPICQTAKIITQNYLNNVPRIYSDEKLEVIAIQDMSLLERD